MGGKFSSDMQDNEKRKFLPSTDDPDQVGVVVINPDGGNILDGANIDVTTKDTVTSITRATISVGTTAVEITASADQRWLRVVPTAGRFLWDDNSSPAADAEDFSKSSPLVLNLETGSIWIEKTSGGAVNVNVYRGIG